MQCNKKLSEKHESEGIMSLVDEKIALNKIRLSAKENPTKLFDRIKAVETRFNTKTTKTKEECLISVALSQAPTVCHGVLASEQRMRKELGVSVEIKDLKEVTIEHHKISQRETEGEDEVGL